MLNSDHHYSDAIGESVFAAFAEKPVHALVEMGAYERLWLEKSSTVVRMAELFRDNPSSLPSDLVDRGQALAAAEDVLDRFAAAGVESFGTRLYRTGDYPSRLRDAKSPVELLYFRGNWDLASSDRSIAVVGTREVSDEGCARTAKLVRLLVDNDFTVVSGLAKGVDAVAHRTAIERGGRTIAVIGTPIHECYPKENSDLQDLIARDYLLISQVPVLRYAKQDYRVNRGWFPERNKTMSALTDATVIVEAGETSGTLIQARAALEQKRKLFILDSCFRNPAISWPAKYEREGAIRVKSFEQILEALAPASGKSSDDLAVES
jgi:DNA processing protein